MADGAREPDGCHRAERRHARSSSPSRAPTGSGSRSEGRILGVVHLKDIVKEGLRERFEELRSMGIRTVMITGDNPLTAQAIAAEAGVDDFLAEATPEQKLELIRREQEGGRLVAMTGDGTNDAPALAQADVGVAMNTGTSAAKEAGNMVDLDSDPTKLIDIVRIGKQLLITRGALTTFSLANDIAKYFAIIPAMFMGVFPGLAVLNVMQLHSPASAVDQRDHLQRDRDRLPHPARAPRREVPAGERLADPAAQPADLRSRRRDRPVHRHQADRPRRQPHPRFLTLRQAQGTGSLSLSKGPYIRKASCPPPAPLCAPPASPSAPCSSSPSCSASATRCSSPASASCCCRGRRTAPPLADDKGSSPDRPVVHGCRRRGPAASTSSRARPQPATATTARPPSGSNLGPENPDLVAAIQERKAAIAEREGVSAVEVPADAVTASGSGLDPHISVAYALLQVPRVAEARGLAGGRRCATLVESRIQGRDLGFLGEERINVAELNLALDEREGA